MLSVSRAKSPAREQAERKNHKENPESFSCGYYVRADASRANPRDAEQVKNNLKKIEKVLKST